MAESEKKSGRMEIKCYAHEKSAINRLARSYGLNTSDYMIRKALGKNTGFDHVAFLNEIHRIGTELSRAGNNINQLSKHANAMNKTGMLNRAVVVQLNVLLENYIRQQERIRAVFRGLLRELKR